MYYSIIFAISFFLFLKEYARKGEKERAGIYKLTRERKRQRSIAWPYLKSARAQSVLSSSIPGKKNAIFKTNRGNESRNFRDGEGKIVHYVPGAERLNLRNEKITVRAEGEVRNEFRKKAFLHQVRIVFFLLRTRKVVTKLRF